MKKVVLICSHLHSGSEALYRSLDAHPRIQGFKEPLPNVYSSGLQIQALTQMPHKCMNRSAIHMDEILYNYQVSTEDVYKYCKFVYVIRSPEATLCRLMESGKKWSHAFLYYKYRMRRLCEMAKRTPGAVLLTFEELCGIGALELVGDYLDLPSSPDMCDVTLSRGTGTDQLAPVRRFEAERIYERYLYFLRSLPLRRLP